MPSLEDSKIPLKTVAVVVLWVASIVGVYYTMKSNVADAQKTSMEANEKIKKLEERFDTYKLDVLTYKVDELQKSITTANDKADKIFQVLNGSH